MQANKRSLKQVQKDVRNSFILGSLTARKWSGGWMGFLDVFAMEHGLEQLKGLKRTTTILELVRLAEEWLVDRTEYVENLRYRYTTRKQRQRRELDFLKATYEKHGVGSKVYDRLVFLRHITGTLFVDLSQVGDQLFAMESSIIIHYLRDDWKKGDPV